MTGGRKRERFLKETNGGSGTHTHPSILLYFINTIIKRRIPVQGHLQVFRRQCLEFLESGYRFRYIMVWSYVDDLLDAGNFTRESLQNMKTALLNLLPYALNLCRYPDQNEYKIIKKYTAYFCCNIKGKLGSLSELADTVLKAMGYKYSNNADELVLSKPSKLIYEVCFELYLSELEFDRIISVVDHLYAVHGYEASEAVQILQEFLQIRGNGGWSLYDCKQFFDLGYKKGSLHKIPKQHEKLQGEKMLSYAVTDDQSLSPKKNEQVSQLQTVPKIDYERENPSSENPDFKRVRDTRSEQWMYGEVSNKMDENPASVLSTVHDSYDRRASDTTSVRSQISQGISGSSETTRNVRSTSKYGPEILNDEAKLQARGKVRENYWSGIYRPPPLPSFESKTSEASPARRSKDLFDDHYNAYKAGLQNYRGGMEYAEKKAYVYNADRNLMDNATKGRKDFLPSVSSSHGCDDRNSETGNLRGVPDIYQSY